MLDELTQITAELRHLGVSVSVAQQTAAARAMVSIDPLDRGEIYAALSMTLVSREEHLPVLFTILDIFLSSQQGKVLSFADLDDDGLRALLVPALTHFDKRTLKMIAHEAVVRHSGFTPGRPVGGSYYVTRTLRWLNLAEAEAQIGQADSAGARGLIAADHARRRARFVREAIDSMVRSLLVADRGSAELARLRRVPSPDEIEFLTASSVQLRQLDRAILPIVGKLARRFRAHRRHPAGPDIRRTIRKAVASGGPVMEILPKLRHRRPPPIVVLADVSESVASFAHFTLSLLQALSQVFTRARAFAFIDDIADISADVTQGGNSMRMASLLSRRTDLVRADGRSDYGHCIRAFLERWPELLVERPIILILGDGRNNARSPEAEAFAAIARRAASIYWLNPEGHENWSLGDSAISRYQPFCTAVVECRTLSQLQRFVATLA